MTELYELLTAYEAERSERRPGGLTASGLQSICDRRDAYDLQGYEPTDEVVTVTAATVGSLLHEHYGELWRQHDPDAKVEVRGEHGQPDVVRDHEIRDLKTLNRNKFGTWVANGGPPDVVWQQLAIYAADNLLLDGAQLVIDALCRETGATATYRHEYTGGMGRDALDELFAREKYLLEVDVEFAGTGDRRGRGDYFCDRCPFRSVCLGDDGDLEQEPVSDVSELEAAAAEYVRGADLEKQGKAMKDTAKKILRGVTGTYGPWRVKWIEQSIPEQYRAPSTRSFTKVTYEGDKK